MSMSSVTRGIALGVGLALMPVAAFAVSVSANDGSGSQTRTASYSNGAAVKGPLKSTSGKKIHYNGKVALGNGCSDPDTGMYGFSTTSKTDVTETGTISTLTYGCPLQGVKSRICTVRSGLPDLCGSDSSTY